MDANIAAVTEALRDLLGPDVRHIGPASGWRWSASYDDVMPDAGIRVEWDIDRNGEVGTLEKHHDIISPWTLDKLHAASQIVRRMVTP